MPTLTKPDPRDSEPVASYLRRREFTSFPPYTEVWRDLRRAWARDRQLAPSQAAMLLGWSRPPLCGLRIRCDARDIEIMRRWITESPGTLRTIWPHLPQHARTALDGDWRIE